MSKARLLVLAALLAILFGAASSRASTPSLIVFAADRTPSVTGEIYRLDPNGHRVDLSRSPFQDTVPAVSSNGKRVAFVSDRGGRTAVYEVGISGRGLVRVRPSIPALGDAGCIPQLVWQPGGDTLAVAACGPEHDRLWIVRRGRKPLKLIDSKNGAQDVSWSPDGRILLASPFRGVYRAFDPAGRPLWKADGFCCGSWSPQGFVGLELGSRFGFRVYDESGHPRFEASGSVTGNLAWSPAGRLAAIIGSRLEVRTATGTLAFTKPLPGGDGLAWADEDHVIVGGYGACLCHERSVDLRTGQVAPLSEANWLGTLSSDRKLAIVTPRVEPGRPFVLGVAPPSGGPVKKYVRLAGCHGNGDWLPAATSLQFVGKTRSLVYQSWNYCDEPFSNLYSAPPEGGHVQRLTNVQAQETQPALSPDGSQTAYVWAHRTGLSCAGCSDGIRTARADGTEIRTLTNPQDCVFDDSPTWSPDASTILFAEIGCDSPSELYTVPTAGGKPHDLGINGNSPAWGPDRIAYVLGEQSGGALWTAKPDGTDRVKVSDAARFPAWSSSGSLAYLTGSSATTVVVGSSQVKLPFALVKSLAWSPDGTRFVVTARLNGAAALDVYTVKTDGTDPVRLTTNFGALGAKR